MRRFRTFAGVFSLALATVPLWAEPPKADPARAQIERNNAAFMAVFKSGDVAAVGRMYAEDAIAFPPDGDMVKGRPAIEAFWKEARDGDDPGDGDAAANDDAGTPPLSRD